MGIECCPLLRRLVDPNQAKKAWEILVKKSVLVSQSDRLNDCVGICATNAVQFVPIVCAIIQFYINEIELNPKLNGHNILFKPLGLPAGVSVRKLPVIQKYFMKLCNWLDSDFRGVDKKYVQSYLDEFAFKPTLPVKLR